MKTRPTNEMIGATGAPALSAEQVAEDERIYQERLAAYEQFINDWAATQSTAYADFAAAETAYQTYVKDTNAKIKADFEKMKANLAKEITDFIESLPQDQKLIAFNTRLEGVTNLDEFKENMRQQMYIEAHVKYIRVDEDGFLTGEEESRLGATNDTLREYSANLKQAAKDSIAAGSAAKAMSGNFDAVAERIFKAAVGLNEISGAFDEFGGILHNIANKNTPAYINAMKQIRASMEDVLGVNMDALSDDFLVKNLKDIQAAADGSVEALDRLRWAAAEDIVATITLDNGWLQEQTNTMMDILSSIPQDIEIGTILETGPYIDGLNTMLEAGAITAAQVNTALATIGYKPIFENQEGEAKMARPASWNTSWEPKTIKHKVRYWNGKEMVDDEEHRIAWEQVITPVPGEESSEIVGMPAMGTEEVPPKVVGLERISSSS